MMFTMQSVVRATLQPIEAHCSAQSFLPLFAFWICEFRL